MSIRMSETNGNHLVERLRRLFGDTNCRLQVAALPWRVLEDRLEVMLVTSRDTGRWVLPKGWADKGESLFEAAAREAREEAGIKGVVSRRDAGRYFYAKVQRVGAAVPCEVIVYPLEVSKLSDNWKEKSERRRQWFTPEAAASSVHEADLAELIRKFGRDVSHAA